MAKDEKQSWIWLEVSDVRFEGGPEKGCCVQLRADREQPKPVWWPVVDTAVRDTAFETYKAILAEMDKKRVVLARLTCDRSAGFLHCDALRFQSAEMGSR